MRTEIEVAREMKQALEMLKFSENEDKAYWEGYVDALDWVLNKGFEEE
jgi:hypothetical protein